MIVAPTAPRITRILKIIKIVIELIFYATILRGNFPLAQRAIALALKLLVLNLLRKFKVRDEDLSRPSTSATARYVVAMIFNLDHIYKSHGLLKVRN